MSYYEGSNWQAKKEDAGKPLYEDKKPQQISKELKSFLVVKDYDNKFHVWTRETYNKYTNHCGEVGGGSAYKIVLDFDGTEDWFKDSPQPPVAGAVWVKASIRLPKEAGKITWRWLDKESAYSGFNGTEFIYDIGGARVDMLYKNEIEWLDESQSSPLLLLQIKESMEGMIRYFELAGISHLDGVNIASAKEAISLLSDIK